MISSISTEQGDHNSTSLRKAFVETLDNETKNWIEQDSQYFLHQALSTPVMNVLVKTEGPYLYDLGGRKYLDLHGNGVHNAGFSNPKVVEAVIHQLRENLAFTPRRYTNISSIKLAKKLVEITPSGLDRVLFCPGGSAAIEMALMLAKQITGRWKTISYWDSYHGTGFQSASVSGEEHFSTGNGPMVPGAFHVEFPNYYRNPWGFESEQQIDEEFIRQIEIILKRNPDVAAILGEPISSTPVVPSLYYWERIKEICSRHGIFLIFDEIIEGFGRTGKMFACEHYVTPDVLVLGKSLGGGIVPYAGIVTRGAFNTLQHKSIGHYTHEKNPLCAAAGLAEIEYIEENKLAEHATDLGQYLMASLWELKNEFPIIGNISGKGLHLGIDLVRNSTTKERADLEAEQVMYHCLHEGVAFKTIEGNIITIRPALTITKNDCDWIVSSLRAAFKKLK